MNQKHIRLAIVIAIVLGAIWALEPRNLGYPRSSETVQAQQTYTASPSAETKAALIDHIHRDVLHNARHGQVLFGIMLLADIVVIYFFWNYGTTKPAA